MAELTALLKTIRRKAEKIKPERQHEVQVLLSAVREVVDGEGTAVYRLHALVTQLQICIERLAEGQIFESDLLAAARHWREALAAEFDAKQAELAHEHRMECIWQCKYEVGVILRQALRDRAALGQLRGRLHSSQLLGVQTPTPPALLAVHLLQDPDFSVSDSGLRLDLVEGVQRLVAALRSPDPIPAERRAELAECLR